MTMKHIYMPKSKVWKWVDIEGTVIEMHKLGEKQPDIARMLKINKRWVLEILREVGLAKPAKEKAPILKKDEYKERDKLIYIQRIIDKRTFKSIGDEHGIHGQRVRQIVDKKERQFCRWWKTIYAKKFPDGVLVDPDGIGEFEDEWTVEEMYKNMFDTVFDS